MATVAEARAVATEAAMAEAAMVEATEVATAVVGMEGAWAARAARAVHRAEEEETVAAARVAEERVMGATVAVATAEEGRGAVTMAAVMVAERAAVAMVEVMGAAMAVAEGAAMVAAAAAVTAAAAMAAAAAVATVAAATEVAEGEATVAVTARWVTIGLKMMNFSPTAAIAKTVRAASIESCVHMPSAGLMCRRTKVSARGGESTTGSLSSDSNTSRFPPWSEPSFCGCGMTGRTAWMKRASAPRRAPSLVRHGGCAGRVK